MQTVTITLKLDPTIVDVNSVLREARLFNEGATEGDFGGVLFGGTNVIGEIQTLSIGPGDEDAEDSDDEDDDEEGDGEEITASFASPPA